MQKIAKGDRKLADEEGGGDQHQENAGNGIQDTAAPKCGWRRRQFAIGLGTPWVRSSAPMTACNFADAGAPDRSTIAMHARMAPSWQS
jgi:hypothetical protein